MEKSEDILKSVGLSSAKKFAPDEELELLKFAVQHGESAVQGQRDALESVRRRAVNLVGINGGILILARFIASEQASMASIPASNAFFSVSEVMAIASFVGATIMCLVLLQSHNGFRFEMSGKKIAARYVTSQNYGSLADAYRDFTELLDELYQSNKDRLAAFHQKLFGAVCLTATHSLFWLIGGFF